MNQPPARRAPADARCPREDTDARRVGAGGSPVAGTDGAGTRCARCLLAPNPSPMTLEGTNTWVVAAPDSPAAVVVDPGPQDETHLRRVARHVAVAGRRVALILLTHGHDDHAAGAERLAELTGAPIRSAAPARCRGASGLADGEVIVAAGCELRVVAAPGHSADSVCLLLPRDNALFTGDTVLGQGTTVIARDGSLGDYLRTLAALRHLVMTTGVRALLPGHGPIRADPVAVLDHYIAHRSQRLEQVRAALAAGARTVTEVTAMVYPDVPPGVRAAAEWSVRAQLDYLNSVG